MNLLIMRHGEALPLGGSFRDDSQRPLSAQGQEQVRRVAEGLKQRQLPITLVISSPLVRARQTATIMAEVLAVSNLSQSPALSPSASPRGLHALLDSNKEAQGMLWVGHHPDVTLWTAFFTGLDPSVCPLFSTASLLALQFHPAPAKPEFLWFQP